MSAVPAGEVIARRGLRHGEPAGRDDRDDDRGGPVARQAADAVLVHDGRCAPIQALSHGDHGAGESNDLGAVKSARRAGGNERGQLDIGIASGHNIAHDFSEFGVVEPPAVNFGANVAQRIEWPGMADSDGGTLNRTEPGPGYLRQGRFTWSQEVARDAVERRNDRGATDGHTNARVGREALGPADVAVASHIDNRFLMGVDAEALEAQCVWTCRHSISILLQGFTVASQSR